METSGQKRPEGAAVGACFLGSVGAKKTGVVSYVVWMIFADFIDFYSDGFLVFSLRVYSVVWIHGDCLVTEQNKIPDLSLHNSEPTHPTHFRASFSFDPLALGRLRRRRFIEELEELSVSNELRHVHGRSTLGVHQRCISQGLQ